MLPGLGGAGSSASLFACFDNSILFISSLLSLSLSLPLPSLSLYLSFSSSSLYIPVCCHYAPLSLRCTALKP